MAAPANVDEFLELVRKSGVADEKRLDAYLQKHRAAIPPQAAEAAKALIQNGLITNFQAENLLAGKWKRFSIGKYKILEKLGSGGMAQVFLCEHKLMRRRVAVKVLPTAKAKDPASLDRFYREARAVAALDHPNIVHAYDIDQDSDLHFLVMEYVDGSNLQDLVKKIGPLPVPRACHYIRQSALALQHAHDAGLVHRDIKPGNILVDRAGLVKILDMGLARFFHDEDDMLTRKYNEDVLGTADYLSPEQALDSHEVDIRADIYSLGATFYYLLTGRAPFESANAAQKLMMHQFKQPKPIAEYRSDVPAEVTAIIDKMMAKDPANRYASPGELADALIPFIGDAIAPPAAGELPLLSLAASGQAPALPSSSDTAVTHHDTPSVKPASARPLPAPATPRPVAIAQGESVEALSWGELAKAKERREESKRKPRSGTKALLLVLLGLLVAIGFVGFVGIALVVWYFYPAPTPQVPAGPPKLEVSKDPARTQAYRSIQLALRSARIGSVIELLDEIHEENVVIEPDKGRTSVTIQAAPGKEVVWRAAKTDSSLPILKAYKANQFKLKGPGITLDGALAKGRIKELILITGDCPGLLIESVHMKNFDRSAVLLMNTAGSADHPIRLKDITTTTEPGQKPRAAIFFDAIPNMTPTINDHIAIADSAFVGLDAKGAIRFSNEKTLGANVSWPGR